MKPCLVALLFVSVAVALPSSSQLHIVNSPEPVNEIQPLEQSPQRNILIDIFVRSAIAALRNLIKNGSVLVGVPPLDPLVLPEVDIDVPTGLVNLALILEDAVVTGLGDFEMPVSKLTIGDLSFDLDFIIPVLDIKARHYTFNGDIFTLIPLYGKGGAHFVVENFRVKAKIFLGQSEDGNAVVFDRIEGAAFEIGSFKSDLTGVIGGGDIDKIVNAVIEEVIVDYVRRFHNSIIKLVTTTGIDVANGILSKFDTWKYIERFL